MSEFNQNADGYATALASGLPKSPVVYQPTTDVPGGSAVTAIAAVVQEHATPVASEQPATFPSQTPTSAIHQPAQTPTPAIHQPATVVPGGSVTPATVEVQPSTIINNSVNNSTGEGFRLKRGRGRPRKYSPSEQIFKAPRFASPPRVTAAPESAEGTSVKRRRGRPSGRTQQPAAVPSGLAGVAAYHCMPQLIEVKAGEDILAKIMTFAQQNTQPLCVLFGTGAVSNVTLRLPASGEAVTYEGRFEILSLSGFFLVEESGGQRSRTGGLTVSLSGHGGNVFGGGAAGLLIAASLTRVFVADFTPKEGQQPPEALSGTAAVGGTQGESSAGPGNTGGGNNGNSQIPSIAWR